MEPRQDTIIKMLISTPRLDLLSPFHAQVIIAMRIMAMAKIKKIDITLYLQKHFGSSKSAWHFSHMMETIQECWPEPMVVNRACCEMTSYDEMLIADLFKAAASSRTLHFHGLLCEMLPNTDVERLHHHIVRLIESAHYKKA